MAETDYTTYQEGTPSEALYNKPLVAYVQNNANGSSTLELIKFNGREKRFELCQPRALDTWDLTEIATWGHVIKWLPVRELTRDELPLSESDPLNW